MNQESQLANLKDSTNALDSNRLLRESQNEIGLIECNQFERTM